MSLALAKVGFALLVFLVGFLGAMLPWGGRSGETSDRVTALGDTFAGGVLGGAGLLHLLVAGVHGFHTVAPGARYPLAFLLTGAGFLLILLIEGVIAVGHSGPHHHSPHPASLRHEIGSGPREGSLRPATLVLLLVLSVHSLIVGMALGAQASLRGAIVVLIAISAHKGVAGFALGVSSRRSRLSRRAALPGVVFFATMTPVGILSGTGVSALLSLHGARLFEAVFDSLAAGTFLYIASLDIISTEFDAPGDHGLKWLAATLGFAVMAVLAVWF